MSQDTIERLRELLGVHDVRLVAMQTRLAEREQDLARLRRELLTALRTTPVQGPTRYLALACGEAILEAAADSERWGHVQTRPAV